MAWYDERKLVSYVGTYTNEKELRRDVDQALRRGWKLQNTTQDGGHINLGRTATGAVLSGGFTLLFGGSRSKGTHTLVFVRDDRWVAQDRLEQELASIKPLLERLAKADSELQKAVAVYTERTGLDNTGQLPGERDETLLREALKVVVDRRERLVREREQLIEVLPVAIETRRTAGALGVSVGDPLLRILDQLDELRAAQHADRDAVTRESVVFAAQVEVERAAKDYHERLRKMMRATQKRADAEHRLIDTQSAVASAAPDKVESAERRVGEAQAEVDRRLLEVASAEVEVEARRERLTEKLRLRNNCA